LTSCGGFSLIGLGTRYAEFIHGLSDLGYIDGKNIIIDFLSADGEYERFPALAVECVRLNPEIIVAYTTLGSVASATNQGPLGAAWSRPKQTT
jgi:hypothetical protein